MLSIRLPAGEVQRLKRAMADYGRQAEFAAAGALNDVARKVRDDLRTALPGAVTIRTAQSARFLRQSIQAPRELQARRGNLSAGVVLDRLRSGLLPTLAAGGENRSGPWGPIPIPTRALRPSAQTPIARGMYPRALGLLSMRAVDGGFLWARTANRTKSGRVRKGQKLGPYQTTNGKWIIRGQARTFALDPRFHRGNISHGVYQRTGPRTIRKLWTYADRVPVPNVVPYQAIANATVAQHFGAFYAVRLQQALATAR